MPENVIDLPMQGRAAEVRAASVNGEERTVEIVWTTGARRRTWTWEDGPVDEELAVDASAVRLGRLNAGAPFLNSHRARDLGAVLGVVVDGSARIEGGNGYARVRFSDREDVEPIWRDIKAGIIRNVSVGYMVHRYEVTKRDGQRPLYRAADWEPLEISAVAIPADPGAHVRSGEGQPEALAPCVLVRQDTSAAPAAANMKGTQTMSGNERQAAAGETERRDDGETPEARAAVPAPQAPAPAPAQVDAAAVRAEERRRVSTINTLCRRHRLDEAFAADLVERGVSLEAAREAILDKIADADPMEGRASERAPAQTRNGQRDAEYGEALSNALMHRHAPGEHKLTDGGREFRGLTLLEMARHALERGGVSTRGMSKMELAGAAFQTRAAVGYHSTSDFPAILANVANKTLRAAYDRTPRTFGVWARRATITDFKQVARTQLGGAPDLEKVLESGEFQYGTIGEGKEVYALATYGRIVAINRQTLINDDLDAFTRIPAAFGASAADLESDIVYSILMDNPAMADGTALFHADHGNLANPATVVSEAALAAAYRAFGQQTGLEGRLISILPRHILVPPGVRSVEARKQVTATTPASTGDVNTFANRLEVIEEPRLIPSGGQDPWFLASDPARIDTVEYAYLDGQEGVYTETRMGFEVDGMEIKARHDFAAKAIDWRGLYKNAGAAPS